MEVAIAGGDEISLIGYSEDISEGGLLVEVLEPLDLGTQVRLSFKLPGDTTAFEAQATVVRVGRNRAGDRYAVALNYSSARSELVERLRYFVMQEVSR